MKTVDEEFEQEFINKEEISRIEENLRIVEQIKPNCKIIKQENEKILKTYKFYEFKLDRLKKMLGDIESKNKNLQMEIKNKTLLFEELRNLLVKSEIKDDHYNALEVQNMDTQDGIMAIEETLETFEEYKKLDYNLRIVVQRKEAIDEILKSFYKKFRNFYNEKLSTFHSVEDGKLKVHTIMYEQIRKYAFILKFIKDHSDENFVILSSIYQKTAQKLYKDEFEAHFEVVLKKFAEKKQAKVISSLEILIESIYMCVKCEILFCRQNLMIEKVSEFVSGIFKEPFGSFYNHLSMFFKIKALEVICALNSKSEMKVEEPEREVWENVQERIDVINNQFRTSFMQIFKDELQTRNYVKNGEHCVYLLEFCNDIVVGLKIVKEGIGLLFNLENNTEEMIKRIKLMNLIFYQIEEKENWNEAINFSKTAINKMMNHFEKMILVFIFDNKSKSAERITVVKKLIGNDKRFLAWFKNLIEENMEPEMSRIINDAFND